MADNRDLNPGQDHYDELYSHNGQIDGINNQAANNWEKDYSNSDPITSGHDTAFDNGPIVDHNNSSRDYLNQGEQASVIQGGDYQSDLSRWENDVSHQTSGFDEARLNRQKASKSIRRSNRFRRHMIAALLTTICTGALAIAGFTAISGPMQLIQAAELFKDFNMGIQLGQQSSRAFQSLKDIVAHNDTSTVNDNVRNSRLGVLGNIQANKAAKRLSEKGVTFSSNNPFGGTSSTDINIKKGLGIDTADLTDDDLSKIVDNFAKETGIPASKISHNGTSLQVENTLSNREMRQLITTLDDPGMSTVTGYMQSRALTRKLGYTSWLHPFQKITTNLENAAGDALDSARNKLKKFIEEQFGPIDQKSGIGDISSRLTSNDEDPSGEMSQDEIDEKKSYVDETTKKISDKADDLASPSVGGGRGIIKNARNFVNSVGYDITGLILAVVCLAQSLYSNNGAFKFVSLVIPLISGSAQISGSGSQAQAGEDIDMETVGLQVEATMYSDDIPVIDAETGEPTGETQTSSFWSNPKVCQTLGTTGCPEESESNTPSLFYTAGDEVNITGNDTLDGLLNDILNDANLGGKITGGACAAYNIADTLLSLLTPVQTFISDAISAIVNQTGVIDNLMSQIVKWISGNPVSLATAIPIVWGAVGMFGSFFMASNQGVQTGGHALTDSETSELNLENRRYLAWQNDRKPILARLFDPSDYNSSLNQIARAAQLNVGDQSLGTQIANVFKAFTSAPSIIATASNQLIGGNAYAAASVDYGVPMIAWDSSTMNEILSNSKHNIYDNAENAIELLKSETSGGDYHQYLEQCHAVQVNDNDYSIEPVDNSDGNAWNYVNNVTGDNYSCAEKIKQDEYQSLSLYVMDYFNTASGACYYGDDDDSEANSACNEMGVDTAGSSGSVGSVDTAGNQPANEMQKAFADETGGVYGAYATSGFGCTTISAWFIGAHTTLVYGHGNGNQVVDNLIASNPGKLTATNKPTKAPAIFSSWLGTLHATAIEGHTGLVTAVHEDGTIETLESGANYDMNGFSYPYSKTFTLSPEEYSGDVKFVYVGDYLK